MMSDRQRAVLVFHGAPDLVEIGAKPEHEIQRDITMEAWIHAGTQNKWGGIVSRLCHAAGAESGYGLFLDGGSGFVAGIRAQSGAKQPFFTGSGAATLPLGEWHHLAATYDGSEVRVYLDGALKKSAPCSGAIEYIGIQSLLIGGFEDSHGVHGFTGKIAEVRLWRVARTQEQIQAAMGVTLGGSEDGLVGYWPMDEGGGDTVHDRAVHGHDGAISGPSWEVTTVPFGHAPARDNPYFPQSHVLSPPLPAAAAQSISRDPPEHRSLDVEALRQEGIALLERLASHGWTDFNTHDPGITLLEQVCYAITELGYRATHDLPDLLAGDDHPYRGLYRPRNILPTEPVTLLDLRKLVLDVEGVRDAWVEPVDEQSPALLYHEGTRELHLRRSDTPLPADRYVTPVVLAGLFRVLIAPSDLADVPIATVRRDVLGALHAHRPLCTDFIEIRVLEAEKIQVNARIEIARGPDPLTLLVQIYEKIAEHLAPPLRFRTLGSMLAAGQPIDEVFSGPRLSRGFLSSEEITRRKRRTELHTSDILHDLMDLTGVRIVHDLGLKSGLSAAGELEPWTLVLQADRTPQLDIASSTITLVRDGVDLLIDRATAIAMYEANMRRAAEPRPMSDGELDRIPPPGRPRHVDRYTSIMHQLPDCYGVGPSGLPDSAPPERKAQQKQLRAYLLLFDQLLCNAFAQLGYVPALFSFDGEGLRSYAGQAVRDDTLGLDPIRIRPEGDHEEWLKKVVDEPSRSPSSRERTHRFLDHLLARFAETHPVYDPIRQSGETVEAAQARDKRSFLRWYPRISAGRGTGVDLLAPPGPGNRSGLAERIEQLLGLCKEQDETFLLVEHVLLRPVEEDLSPLGEGELRPIPPLPALSLRDPYSMQVTFVFPDWPARFADPQFRQLVEQTVRGETPAHIIPYVDWMPRDAFFPLLVAHDRSLFNHRSYWSDRLGIQP